jgi:hypothetical protein
MEENNFILNEPHQPDYEKAEMDLLRDALKRTYQERFYFLTRLMKIQATMKRAKMTYNPLPPNTES